MAGYCVRARACACRVLMDIRGNSSLETAQSILCSLLGHRVRWEVLDCGRMWQRDKSIFQWGREPPHDKTPARVHERHGAVS